MSKPTTEVTPSNQPDEEEKKTGGGIPTYINHEV